MKTKILIPIIAILLMVSISTAFNATGGTVTYDGLYQIHTFKTNGINNATFNLTVTGTGNAEILVVAGGGGAATSGGGAGGLIYDSSYALTPGNKTVIIGAGGFGDGSTPFNGQNSIFDGTLTAIGGGAGTDQVENTPGNGGSGGGGGQGTGGTGTIGQGNNGGNGEPGGILRTGGGGGAGFPGGNASDVIGKGGVGGDGLNFAISGTNTYYAGGGAGSCLFAGCTPSQGGLGGGGNSTVAPYLSIADLSPNGTNGLGGGGGGAESGQGQGVGDGGNGGSGVVIVRLLPSQPIIPTGGYTPTYDASDATPAFNDILVGIIAGVALLGSLIGFAIVYSAINEQFKFLKLK